MTFIRLTGVLILISPIYMLPSIRMAVADTESISTPWQAMDKYDGNQSDDVFKDQFDDKVEEPTVADPLEKLNRGIFWFNDKVYFYALKPVARVVRVVPEPVRTSVGNAFHNIAAPIRIVNATFQLKFHDAGTELGRFVINSTIGILGLFDPAGHYFGLKPKEADFGQTLAHYGVGQGVYIVLPFLGPSSLRDATGTFTDVFFDPVYYLTDKQTKEIIEVKATEVVNTVSLDKDTYEAIKLEALDPYVVIRSAYAQHRAAKVQE